MIARLIQMLRGWQVVIEWEGQEIIHRASCWSDALAWKACYPVDASVLIQRHGKMIALS